MDWASVSELLHCQYLTTGGGHITRCDNKASDWMRGMVATQRASMTEFNSSDV